MSSFCYSAILSIVWIFGGYYTIQALGRPESYKNSNINTVYWMCCWAALITWILIGFALLFVIRLLST